MNQSKHCEGSPTATGKKEGRHVTAGLSGDGSPGKAPGVPAAMQGGTGGRVGPGGGVLELQWGRGSSVLCFSHPCCSPSARSPQPVTQPLPTGCKSLQTSLPCLSHRRSPPPHTRLRSPAATCPGPMAPGVGVAVVGSLLSPRTSGCRAQGHNQLTGLFVPTTG